MYCVRITSDDGIRMKVKFILISKCDILLNIRDIIVITNKL